MPNVASLNNERLGGELMCLSDVAAHILCWSLTWHLADGLIDSGLSKFLLLVHITIAMRELFKPRNYTAQLNRSRDL